MARINVARYGNVLRRTFRLAEIDPVSDLAEQISPVVVTADETNGSTEFDLGETKRYGWALRKDGRSGASRYDWGSDWGQNPGNARPGFFIKNPLTTVDGPVHLILDSFRMNMVAFTGSGSGNGTQAKNSEFVWFFGIGEWDLDAAIDLVSAKLRGQLAGPVTDFHAFFIPEVATNPDPFYTLQTIGANNWRSIGSNSKSGLQWESRFYTPIVAEPGENIVGVGRCLMVDDKSITINNFTAQLDFRTTPLSSIS